MQDIFVSVRRSLVFKPSSINDNGGGGGGGGGGRGGFVERIGSSIRKSRVGLFANPVSGPLPPPSHRRSGEDEAPAIRWRKGELIGCGAFGRVYMGMNLDSGELLAIKQVLITANSASKEKTQEHIRELEEEVKLLRNLSHPNIVRYLGTAREDDSLNILLEFVPGGSISSLLGKFGSFPESVIKMYTKQILLGLEYLHKNKILHRDIKGANILVDNKGCIKLADFGASKKVVELATMTGAKSMKGTPYWMAPEVILQTGHSFSADIWSVGCTVIEMATGKPPWSQQYQEVAALFHIGTTKSHPPIPEHLSFEAKDFLLKCLQKEPHLRLDASELLKHPFVTGGCLEPDLVAQNGAMESNLTTTSGLNSRNSVNSTMRRSTCAGLKDVCEMYSLRSSTAYPGNLSGLGSRWGTIDSDDDMCQIDDKDEFGINSSNACKSVDVNKSFNPMSEPTDDWPYKLDESSASEAKGDNVNHSQSAKTASILEVSGNEKSDLLFPCGSEDDDEVTESKIKAFLDDKAFELKKMQTPLYEEFYNTLNGAYTSAEMRAANNENQSNVHTRPPISKSPKRLPNRRLSAVVDAPHTNSPGGDSNRIAHASRADDKVLHEIQPPQVNEWPDSERQRKWEEELVQELERKRELMRQAGVGGKTLSPKERFLTRHRERLRFPFPGK